MTGACVVYVLVHCLALEATLSTVYGLEREGRGREWGRQEMEEEAP